ncbi:hypothetical protein [Actinoplanes sp. NPDC026619]|uniref:hypothetical protein n=1 Tax=Actinoplanes sp. NPDC026619 TaxID=3155798 RepID=UPI0033F5D06F
MAVLLVLPTLVLANYLSAPPAAAAVSAPLVIGLTDRSVVLAATAKTTGSYLTTAAYVPDINANAGLQRWTFESVTKTTLGYIFLVRNAASGLCMTPNAHFGLYLQPCNLSGSWLYTNTAPTTATGYRLRAFASGRAGECLNADSHPSTDPSRINPDSCYTSDESGERWRVRPGVGSCPTVDVTATCQSYNPPRTGFFGNWKQSLASFTSGKNAEIAQYLGGKTVDSQFFDRVPDWFEVGWRNAYSTGNGTTPPKITDEAYWLESAPGFVEYHSLSAAAGGSVGDGLNHTYMALSAAGGKVDILYDYDTVGTTTHSEGSGLSYLETGITKRDDGTAVLPSGIEHRVQGLDPNGVWQRLPAAAAVVNDRQCDGPSTMLPSAAPNCVTVSLKTVANANGGSDLENIGFTQPAAATPTAPVAPSIPPAAINGVDQQQLHACMQNTPADCLRTVPGLDTCVAARLQCNLGVTAPAKFSRTRPPAMTVAQARAAARKELRAQNGKALGSATALTVKTVPAGALRSSLLASGEPLLVVSGTATVSGFQHGRPAAGPYRGFVLTYDAATGDLVNACLGSACFNRPATASK